MFGYLFLVIGIILGMIFGFIKNKKLPKNESWQILANWIFLFGIGLTGIFGFFGHTVMADYTANFIGWPTGSPFQTEVAIANLGLGVLGIISFFTKSYGFKLATLIEVTIFLWGAAIGHVYHTINDGNSSGGNYGMIIPDIIIPLAIITLFLIAYKNRKNIKEN